MLFSPLTRCLLESLEARKLMSVGDAYVAPAAPSVTVNENPGWKFQLNPSGTPQAGTFNDAAWASVSLPHTWNQVDALANSPASGNGWYRKTVNLTPDMAGKSLYLQFEGGDLVTSLYVDGTQIDLNPASVVIDSHSGGYQSFAFDVTAALNAAVPAGQSGHVIAVKVNNQSNANVAPSGGGGYTYFGGLYRDVSLLAVDPTHIAVTQTVSHAGLSGADVPSQLAGAGVTFSNSTVAIGSASATLTFKTTLDNLSATSQTLAVNSYLVDAAGVIRAQSLGSQAVSSGQTGVTLTQTATIANPHLWDGRIDPYLYTLYVEVRRAGDNALLDLSTQKVGIRSFKFNANPNPTGSDPNNVAAFMLNGHAYRLVGANAHQDSGRLDASGQPVGYAQSDAQIQADLDLLADMGGTAVRTSHYQDNQAFYDYCDQIGIMIFTEAPVKSAQANDTFRINALDQYNELIRQNINHPSVFAWGFGNEVSDDSAKTLFNLFKQFQIVAKTLDPNRATALSDYGQTGPSYNSDGTPANSDAIADILDTHLYTYWYSDGQGVKISKNTRQPQGTAEYGGGGSAYQYADSFTLPVSAQTGGVTTRFHPQNQLEQIHQRQYTDLTALNFIWGQIVWQMFDNASPGQSQGDTNGLNDKGLVTRDRVPKDAYNFYKAVLNDPSRSWNNQRVLTFGDRFWTVRNNAATTVTVYSNLGAPALTLNGTSLGTMAQLNVTGSGLIPNTYTMNVTLATGMNNLQVARTYAGQTYTDTANWSFRNAVAGNTIARIDFAPSGQAAVSGYVTDTGAAYGAQNGQTYGWLPASGSNTAFGSVLAVGSTFGTASAQATTNGINLNYSPVYKTSSTWEYALPNGAYDVMIGAGQASTSDGVNHFAIEGKTATIDSNGNNTQDTFYARVIVTDGKLTLTAAPGAVNARLTYLKINAVDTTAPTLQGSSFNYLQGQSITLQFSEAISGLTGSSLRLHNNTTNQDIDSNLFAVSLLGSTATFTFPGLLAGLPDGVYTATLLASGVTDAAGVPLAGNGSFTFFSLAGDANRDGKVDVSDLGILSSHWQGTGDFSTGDFNNDGKVDVSDLGILSTNWQKSLDLVQLSQGKSPILPPSKRATTR